MKNRNIYFFVLFILLGGLIGYGINELIQINQNNKIIDGLRFELNGNLSEAKKYANNADAGDWVCVNVRGMTYERAVEVCDHEVGHEIFAEFCEQKGNIDKCINITK